MRFRETPVAGAWVIELEVLEDERGGFARTFAQEEFAARGLEVAVVQCSLSRNRRAGTLRGLHWQAPPHGEAKLIRCTRGAAWDVLLDVRPGSPTQGRWFGVELAGDDDLQVYAPEGVAHGFVTLADDTELSYQMSAPYEPSAARGVRWDDPGFAIEWPRPPTVMSEADRTRPDHRP